MNGPSQSDAHVAKHLGSGWISGVLSAVLGGIGLGAVLCFHFPSLLTVPELRQIYPVPYIRFLLLLILIASLLLGVLSIYLRPTKVLGLSGITLALISILLGGSSVPVEGELSEGPFFGLDLFLLNLLAFSLIFVPLELWFPKRAEQPIFRQSWRTDLVYFFFSAFFVQLIALLTMRPAAMFFQWVASSSLQTWVAELPFILQFLGIVLVADFFQYWVHRAFHSVPILWRFHAVHHSAKVMDWLAGSRLHLADVVLTRGITYIPIYVLGFAEGPLFAYIIFVSVHATFIHSNIRFEYGPFRKLIVTPQFHHWHHTSEESFLDRNFAVHFPWLDRIFGTYYLPSGVWPTSFGLADVPESSDGYFTQLVEPFRSQRK